MLINNFISIDTRRPSILRAPGEQWSGEATRGTGFIVEDARVDVTIGDESPDDGTNHRKERPIWMMESTIINSDGSQVYLIFLQYFVCILCYIFIYKIVLQPDGVNTQESILDKAAATATNTTTTNNKQGEDIMSVLLAHEKKGSSNSAVSIKAALPQESSDSSDNEDITDMQTIDTGITIKFQKLHLRKFAKSKNLLF